MSEHKSFFFTGHHIWGKRSSLPKRIAETAKNTQVKGFSSPKANKSKWQRAKIKTLLDLQLRALITERII